MFVADLEKPRKMTTKKESSILKDGLIRASRLGYRMFRINVGSGWTGSKFIKTVKPKMVTLMKGDILIRQARPLSTGAPKGFPDTVGWKEIEITQDMVGTKIAQFVGHEYKTPTGQLLKDQKHFLSVVEEAGGEGRVIRSSDDI